MSKKMILDACCGSSMFWFDKEDPRAVFMDIRKECVTGCDGRTINVNPDVIGDFRDMPFPNDHFRLVVFDPPHLLRAGENSWLAQKYGKLNRKTWRDDLRAGFLECFRVEVFTRNDDIYDAAANTRLIAAAPEMYGILEHYLGLIQKANNGDTVAEQKIFEQSADIEKVLKKARGEE